MLVTTTAGVGGCEKLSNLTTQQENVNSLARTLCKLLIIYEKRMRQIIF